MLGWIAALALAGLALGCSDTGNTDAPGVTAGAANMLPGNQMAGSTSVGVMGNGGSGVNATGGTSNVVNPGMGGTDVNMPPAAGGASQQGMGGAPLATAGTANMTMGGGSNMGMAGGASGGAGAVTPGSEHTGPSAGCGRMEPLAEPPRQYVQHDMNVEVDPEYQPDYTTREYHTWLPENYDPNRAYPLYFWGNGCGVTQGNPEGIPVANIDEVRTGAILVFMIQENGCFDAGKGGKANTPDIPYFTQMLQEVEDSYCVDRDKVFVGGYSSTAWFAATLSCSHGDKLAGIAMAAGGQQDELPMCTGPAALILWAGNEGPGGNPIDTPPDVEWEGSGAVRDRLIAENGCSQTTTKWDDRWPSCDLYDDCGKNPVVFCPHGGGHDTGGGSGMNSDGFWQLFKSTW